jgi:hypothetical protein
MKRENKYKIGFTIIILAAIAVVVVFVLLRKDQKNQVEAVPTPQVDASNTSSPEPGTTIVDSNKLSDWHVYDNMDYGFRVTFTDIWKGYEVKTAHAPKEQVESAISFDLKTSDQKYSASGGVATPLTIYVYKENKWNDESKALFPQTEVARCQGFVFTYSTWEEAPQDIQGLTDKSIADTLKGFQTSCTK